MDDTLPPQNKQRHLPEIAVHATFRFLQFVLGLTVAGLYADGLTSSSKPARYNRNKWAYAVAVAAMSLLTAIVCVMPYVRRFVTWPWDFLLLYANAVVLGMFAGLYMDNGPLQGGSTRRVKSAAFVDLTNLLLWFITGAIGAALHYLGPKPGEGDLDRFRLRTRTSTTN